MRWPLLVADPAMRDALTVSDNGKILDWDDLNVENEPIDIILSLPEEKPLSVGSH